MTKYLQSTPFSNGPATKEYRENWEIVFGNDTSEIEDDFGMSILDEEEENHLLPLAEISSNLSVASSCLETVIDKIPPEDMEGFELVIHIAKAVEKAVEHFKSKL